MLEAAIEAGAEDVESDEDGHRIWTSIENLHEVARALEPMLGESEGAEARVEASSEVEVRGDDAQQLMKLIDALEEDDDVQTVWGNYDVPEEELEKLANSPACGRGWGRACPPPSCARSHSFHRPLPQAGVENEVLGLDPGLGPRAGD